MEALLREPGKTGLIGPETGKVPARGIGVYKSENGSTRYVMYIEAWPVSVLQVVSKDGKSAVIANVFTIPDQRRQGLATELLRRARQDFETIEHAKKADMSADGMKWEKSVEILGAPHEDQESRRRERRRLVIRYAGGYWWLFTHDGHRVLGQHATFKEAHAQEKAIQISKARAAGHEIPRRRKAR